MALQLLSLIMKALLLLMLLLASSSSSSSLSNMITASAFAFPYSTTRKATSTLQGTRRLSSEQRISAASRREAYFEDRGAANAVWGGATPLTKTPLPPSLLLAQKQAEQEAIAPTTTTIDPVSATTIVERDGLLVDLPMERLRLPFGALGREYVAIKLKIQGRGPFTFMIDTGLTMNLITTRLHHQLGIDSEEEGNYEIIEGLTAGGSTSSKLVELKGVTICGSAGDSGEEIEIDLPPLSATITNFPQEHMDRKRGPVVGMLGMETLSLFDVDLDFRSNRVRLWKPGTAQHVAKKDGLVEIPAVVINESGLYGMRVSTPHSTQPVIGLLDCGSTFSAMNWSAAKYLALPDPKKNKMQYVLSPAVLAQGIDGRTLQLPTQRVQLTFTGDIMTDPKSGEIVGFTPPPKEWKPWNPVRVAVGDLPAFSAMLGDGVHPFKEPAALIGLDVLAQRRVILETGVRGTRQRRIWVSPK